ncbi:MAG: malto-oligosyltrehalose trehalohydrolase [Planctomycetes bacterium]|nr:malto-oligosyltrehalose trehalohydrolase [Planctomycetota bacterium]
MQSPIVHPFYPRTLGALPLEGGRTQFRVWAPKAQRVEVELIGPDPRVIDLQPGEHGYFHGVAEGVGPGARYLYLLDGERRFPDPASRYQPEGVHQPSEVVDPRFDWTDHGWAGLPLAEYIIYELHVGTFTEAGTFEAVIDYLDELRDVGVTAIELLPVAQFPGGRNWGYDGVYLFGAQNTYGGPWGLKKLIDACHARGLAVVMDVVYNHLGPEGNYLAEFGHYFTERHRTPWGAALNFDGPHSDEVRRFFIENALSWVDEYRIDALRLDAVHAIFDQSARPFLRELAQAVRLQGELSGRRIYTIAESNLNDPRMVRPRELGGNGLDAQWVDDLHHALHSELTGENAGYYSDFHGFPDLVCSFRDGFVFYGQYSRYRMRRHGEAATGLPATSFVVCSQNHDQVGNRMLGERLSTLCSFEELKLAAAVVLLSPYVPLLWMGEEYGEPAPFQFFTSHGDEGLVEAVRKGRRQEFASFRWQGEPPDPQAEETFRRSRLNHNLRGDGRHAVLREFYKTLIRLRKTTPSLAILNRDLCEMFSLDKARLFGCIRRTEVNRTVAIYHFGHTDQAVSVPVPKGRWRKVLDSAEDRWQGPGSSLPVELESSGEVALSPAPRSAAVYLNDE